MNFLQLEILQAENATVIQSLSSLHKAHEKLSMDLKESIDAVEFWEDQCRSKEEIVRKLSMLLLG